MKNQEKRNLYKKIMNSVSKAIKVQLNEAINIPKNNYKQPSEVREYVVQAICDAFLDHDVLHLDGTRYKENWEADIYVYVPDEGNNYYDAEFINQRQKNDTYYYKFSDGKCVKFTGAEMKQAFKELIKAGYYMFKMYEYDYWQGYICHDKPFYKDGIRVNSFNERID